MDYVIESAGHGYLSKMGAVLDISGRIGANVGREHKSKIEL
jgi:hypothetical protein